MTLNRYSHVTPTSDGSQEEVGLANFAEKGITTVPVNGAVLSASDTKVIISAGEKSVVQPITVEAAVPPAYASTNPLANPNVSVAYGTDEADAIDKLDKTVGVVGTKDETGLATIAWTIADYDGDTAADYIATGVLTLPDGWTGSPNDVTAEVMVSVFGGGNGSEVDPYLVASAAQLNAVRNHLDQHFKQVREIDLADYQSGSGWVPIGSDTEPFSGSYNGDGHEIKNSKISSDNNNIGLFGCTSSKAKIAGIKLVAVEVSGVCYVGGLVGRNCGIIENCSATGDVTGSNDSVGGLVGYNKWGTIETCYATGAVTGSEHYVGGLVGSNNGGTIADGYATGKVEGQGAVGGLVGGNYDSIIENCYATGSVTGDKWTGGLVGSNDFGAIENSYYDTDTTGMNDTGKGIPKTTDEMKAGLSNDNIYTGWDTATIWTIEEGHYPWLKWQGAPLD